MNTYLPIVSLLNETLCMKRIIKSSRMRPPPSLFHLKGGHMIQPPPINCGLIRGGERGQVSLYTITLIFLVA